MNNHNWFSESDTGIQLNSLVIYEELYEDILDKINQGHSVEDILKWIEEKAVEVCKENYNNREPTRNSLNNSKGRWNESIALSFFSEIAIEKNKQNTPYFVAIFSLPNAPSNLRNQEQLSSIFLRLFNQTEFQPGNPLAAINELKNKIFFSSPDYVIVHLDSTKHPRDKINDLLKEQIKKPNSLNLYDHFKGKILASDVKAAISLKTTNRPDRRYQPLFEAAMLKAINHVANQKWRYYMVTRKFSDNDRIVFMEGISPHGIIVNKRIPLVDGIYPYNTKNDLSSLVTDALT